VKPQGFTLNFLILGIIKTSSARDKEKESWVDTFRKRL
jgi:hypothetical protein